MKVRAEDPGEPLFVIRAPGSLCQLGEHTASGALLVDDYDSACGEVVHGVGVRFRGEYAGFVLSLDDLEHVVKEARAYQATLADIHARVDPLLKPKGE